MNNVRNSFHPSTRMLAVGGWAEKVPKSFHPSTFAENETAVARTGSSSPPQPIRLAAYALSEVSPPISAPRWPKANGFWISSERAGF